MHVFLNAFQEICSILSTHIKHLMKDTSWWISFHKCVFGYHVTKVITVSIFKSTKHHFNISVRLLLFHSSFSVEPPFWLSQNLVPVFPMFSDCLSYFLLKFTIVFSQSFGEPFFEIFGFGSSVDKSRIKIRAYWYKGL